MTDNKKRGRPKAINPRSKQYRMIPLVKLHREEAI